MPVTGFGPADVGGVVSLRVMTSGGPTDVVGRLVAVTADRLSIRRRDGRMDEVPLAAIAAGRRVPPTPAERIAVGDLERLAADGWRAVEQAGLGSWLLRAAGGFTRRANSALALGDPGRPLDEALAAVRRWYDERGLPARVQVTDGATDGSLDGLTEAGWRPSAPAIVMTGEVAHVLRAAGPADVDVRLDPDPDDAWLGRWRQDAGPLPAVARDVLTNHPCVVFASVRQDGECVAIARVTVHERWAGLFAVEVAPHRRRQRLGTALTSAALRWAAARGARHVFLQTVPDNLAAIGLYERLGLGVHHSYRFFE